ncbi:hypothetical protein [Paractinoplanes durhamensis]|uniref:Uncharacterized protein n=1 Tax=Paractinoplanes durhamensis TaxID=113563 RepID=A0ABQ3YNY3_9ACTN|nr:hypothetical protein [Actinoplanes durhamensis]GID99296.1 hypothetical protein Adu01nite_06470 [Actinoplanes durhamensis]
MRASIPNQWVERFYHRLDDEVRTRASGPSGLRIGSLYFATEGDARRAHAAGLPPVRVLVPLYTREFLHSPPPDFSEYLHRPVHPTDLPFIHPVLWDAYIPARSVSGLAQAMSLGNFVGEYADCGMLSICRLSAYANELRQIVELLAERVVYAAEHPDQMPEWVRSAPALLPSAAPEARFLISVIRPKGDEGDWSPFGGQPGAVTDRAVQAAHRLVLLPEIVTSVSVPVSVNGTRESAGVLLLDAAALDEPAARPMVMRLLPQLPSWMTVVLVFADNGDEAHTLDLADEVRVLVRHGVQVARDAAEFEQVIDEAVRRARRNFLRGHPNRTT